MIVLEDYRPFVGDDVIAEIHKSARRLIGRRLLHINSTYQGGGVAELLNSIVPLMNDVGMDADWRILAGDYDFFEVTKKFHNGLQGQAFTLTRDRRERYEEVNARFASFAQFDRDVVLVHDPQPLALSRFVRKRQAWVWQCHVDLTAPNPALWDYLKGFIMRYDLVLVSHPDYRREDLGVEQRVVTPAIDPLASKNIDLTSSEVNRLLEKAGVPRDKPLLTQISRFDPWKDQLGALEIFKKVRQECDCRLVLAGATAADDPESSTVFAEVERRARKGVAAGDIILISRESSSATINALQRASAVILQKSLREGFGLTVAEAMWKARPVVASRVGGIPLQMVDGQTGMLVEPEDIDGAAAAVVRLLKNPEVAAAMGAAGRERVRERFLITRMLHDYLEIFAEA